MSVTEGADIFEFWSKIPPTAKVHPADQPIFDRLGKHAFSTKALPSCFMGRLKVAPVVLLFLSPGLGSEDETRASRKHVQWLEKNRSGLESLVPGTIHQGAYKWWTERTARFGTPEELADKVAFLNIGAYRSKIFNDHALLAALPSSRVCLGWAQSVLFPQAERGERVVVCLRAARWWGLETGRKYAGTLFAPKVTRGGHMLKSERDRIVRAVRQAIGPK